MNYKSPGCKAFSTASDASEQVHGDDQSPLTPWWIISFVGTRTTIGLCPLLSKSERNCQVPYYQTQKETVK